MDSRRAGRGATTDELVLIDSASTDAAARIDERIRDVFAACGAGAVAQVDLGRRAPAITIGRA